MGGGGGGGGGGAYNQQEFSATRLMGPTGLISRGAYKGHSTVLYVQVF